MKRRHVRLLLLLTFLLLLPLMVGGWLVSRQARQVRLNTALIAAVKRNSLADVRRLLAQGADPNSQDRPVPNLSLWQMLLAGLHPHSTSAQDNHYPTALLLACEPDLEHGLSPEYRTPVALALIAAGANVNVANPKGWTPLMSAAVWNLVPLAQAVLQHGADVNTKDTQGDTALYSACEEDKVELLRLLLEHGAKIPAHFSNRNTPLNQVTGRFGSQAVRLLAAYGADSREIAFGETVLTEAAAMGNLELVRFWLAHGHLLEERNNEGYTALITAANNDALPVVKFLLAQGANVKARGKDDETALSLAGKADYNVVARFLQQAGARE